MYLWNRNRTDDAQKTKLGCRLPNAYVYHQQISFKYIRLYVAWYCLLLSYLLSPKIPHLQGPLMRSHASCRPVHLHSFLFAVYFRLANTITFHKSWKQPYTKLVLKPKEWISVCYFIYLKYDLYQRSRPVKWVLFCFLYNFFAYVPSLNLSPSIE